MLSWELWTGPDEEHLQIYDADDEFDGVDMRERACQLIGGYIRSGFIDEVKIIEARVTRHPIRPGTSSTTLVMRAELTDRREYPA